MIEIKHPTSEMINDVLEYMNACDIAEIGKPDSSLDDLAQDWDEIDLEKDAWIVVDDGRICGYACVMGEEQRYTIVFIAHQLLTPAGWADDLFKCALERVNEFKAAQKAGESITIIAYAGKDNQEVNDVLLRFGFSPHTWIFRMQKELTVDEGPVVWPEEFDLKAFRAEDEEELYHLIEKTFDWQEHVMPSIDIWRDHLFRSGRYDPEFFIMVRRQGKLVGAALCYNEEPGGWVRQLAIARELQHQGYGSKLLKHVFHRFAQAGVKSMGLAVASVNQNAFEFYERCGMRKVLEITDYRKTI